MVNARDHYVQPSDEGWSAAPNFCLLPSWHGPSESCGGAGVGVGGGQVPLGESALHWGDVGPFGAASLGLGIWWEFPSAPHKAALHK